MAVERFPTQVYYIKKEEDGTPINKKSSPNSSNNNETDGSSVAEEDVDVERNRRGRCFVMDVCPDWAGDFEVGTVDSIAKEVKTFLMDFFGGTAEASVGDIDFEFSLQHNKYLDCPVLWPGLSYTSKYGNQTYGTIGIYALSGNVQDIFQLLLKMEIACFQPGAIHEKYIAELRDFLSSNPFLRKLHINHVLLKHDPELMMRDVFKSSRTLSTLALGHQGRQPKEVFKEYFSHIHECQSLTRLHLQVECFTPAMMDGLVEGLTGQARTKLKILDMGLERTTYLTDISKIAKALRKSNTITTGVEEWNTSGRVLENFESILQCAKLIKHNQSPLKKLDLRQFYRSERCLIHPDTWIFVGKALAQASTLQYLDLSYHRISAESWKALGEGLKANSTLKTFKAIRHHFVDRETTTDMLLPVLEALRENKTLQSLELSRYDLSNKSFASLKVLESILTESRSSPLKSLEWVDSGLTDDGAEILTRSLPKMRSIEKLHLGLHHCTVKGARAFAEGMKKNYSLVSVSFGGLFKGRWYRGCVVPPMAAEGFEKEFHEIEYYARMDRKGRRCMLSETSVNPSLWPLVLAKAQKEEKPNEEGFSIGDVREFDCFAGDPDTGKSHDTSIDAVFYLLRDVVTLPV